MNKKILIIEDNEQNLYMMTFLLTSAGYEVIHARDGQQGIQTAVAEKPYAILLDIQLPVMDGYQVARELRKNADLATVPIITVTSFAMVGDKEQCLAAGATGYMEKPINPETFISELRNYFR